MHYIIKEPVWKDRTVGVDVSKLDDNNSLEIIYKDKKGERVYPCLYKFTKNYALCAKRDLKHQFLAKLPISHLEIMKEAGRE